MEPTPPTLAGGFFTTEPPEGKSESESRSVVSERLAQPHGLQPVRLLCPWDFPSKNTGVGCQFFLLGIFPDQGWNTHLLHGWWILYC